MQQIFSVRKLAAAAIGCALTASGLVACSLLVEQSCDSLESSYRELAAEPALKIAPPAAEIREMVQMCDADGGSYWVMQKYSSTMSPEELKEFYRSKMTELGFRQEPRDRFHDEDGICFIRDSENVQVQFSNIPVGPRYSVIVERLLDGSDISC